MASDNDKYILQQELGLLTRWSHKWLLSFNVSKCVHLRITPKRKQKVETFYSLCGKQIPVDSSTKYLGVTISDSLDPSLHASNITNRANRSVGVIRRNFNKCSEVVRLNLYKSIAGPHSTIGICCKLMGSVC